MKRGYPQLLAILTSVLLVVPYRVHSDDDLITETCKSTPHFDLCVSSLKSDPGSSTADVEGLAAIVANVTLSDATTALAEIQQLIKEATDPQQERPLDFCGEVYIELVQEVLPQAMDALARGNYKFVNYGASFASKLVDSCEKKFSGSVKSPISDENVLVHDLGDVTVAIVNLLIEGVST